MQISSPNSGSPPIRLCIVLAPTARCVTCTLPVMTLVTCNTKTCRFKISFSLYIFLLVISTGSIALSINTFTIPTIQRHATTDVWQGLNGSKAYFAVVCVARDQYIITSLTKRFTAPHNLSVTKLEKRGITDVSSASGYIQHWEMLLFISILNLN